MGLPTYCLVVTITEKVKRITEEMHLEFMVIMMMILMVMMMGERRWSSGGSRPKSSKRSN